MTEQELDATIALAVGKDKANAIEIAKACRQAAVLRIGRMRGVDFNKELITLTTVAGKASYVIGKDFASSFPVLKNIQNVWRTDRVSAEVQVVPLDEFSAHARGSSTAGGPRLATIHTSGTTIELWPTPDAAYALKCSCKKSITALKDIPNDYHDAVLAVGITIASYLQNPEGANYFLRDVMKDIQEDTMLGWDGSRFDVDRILDQTNTGRVSDSHNLLGG